MDPEKGEIDRKKLDRFIGVATNVGTLIKLWCLLPSGHVISRSSITLVTVNEIAQTSIQQRLKYLNTAIYNKIGDELSDKDITLTGLPLPPVEIFDDVFDLSGTSSEKPWDLMESGSAKPEADNYTAEVYDKYLNTKIKVPLT